MQTQARILFPDGRAHIVPLLSQPRSGEKLAALGVQEGAWIVADFRTTDNPDAPYDVWVHPPQPGLN
jgi:hypothetical protein